MTILISEALFIALTLIAALARTTIHEMLIITHQGEAIVYRASPLLAIILLSIGFVTALLLSKRLLMNNSP